MAQIYQSAQLFPLVFAGEKNQMPLVCRIEVGVEEDVTEREVSKGKHRILEGVLWG